MIMWCTYKTIFVSHVFIYLSNTFKLNWNKLIMCSSLQETWFIKRIQSKLGSASLSLFIQSRPVTRDSNWDAIWLDPAPGLAPQKLRSEKHFSIVSVKVSYCSFLNLPGGLIIHTPREVLAKVQSWLLRERSGDLSLPQVYFLVSGFWGAASSDVKAGP